MLWKVEELQLQAHLLLCPPQLLERPPVELLPPPPPLLLRRRLAGAHARVRRLVAVLLDEPAEQPLAHPRSRLPVAQLLRLRRQGAAGPGGRAPPAEASRPDSRRSLGKPAFMRFVILLDTVLRSIRIGFESS